MVNVAPLATPTLFVILYVLLALVHVVLDLIRIAFGSGSKFAKPSCNMCTATRRRIATKKTVNVVLVFT